MDDAPLPHLPLKLLTSYSLTGPHAAHLWNQVMALLERTRALREEVVVLRKQNNRANMTLLQERRAAAEIHGDIFGQLQHLTVSDIAIYHKLLRFRHSWPDIYAPIAAYQPGMAPGSRAWQRTCAPRRPLDSVILLTDSVYQKTEGPLEGRRELISNRLTLLSTPGRARCTIPDSQIPEDLWPRQHSPQ